MTLIALTGITGHCSIKRSVDEYAVESIAITIITDNSAIIRGGNIDTAVSIQVAVVADNIVPIGAIKNKDAPMTIGTRIIPLNHAVIGVIQMDAMAVII
ncbi:unnamed protein product [marine sediment metagenome]|uniref:Uncharacterized protein n=1 Tax=marine sediment metagenome TaxID=412755 RepID=X1NHF0_9ZZZZ